MRHLTTLLDVLVRSPLLPLRSHLIASQGFVPALARLPGPDRHRDFSELHFCCSSLPLPAPMPEAEPTQTARLTAFPNPALETKVGMLGTDSEYALLWL